MLNLGKPDVSDKVLRIVIIDCGIVDSCIEHGRSCPEVAVMNSIEILLSQEVKLDAVGHQVKSNLDACCGMAWCALPNS